jgi:hypothetical protein
MRISATTKQEVIPQLKARQVFELIQPDMSLVEAEFERQASSNVQVIDYLG